MITQFPGILREATARIDAAYFQLPVAGMEDPVYRERVYCYELYHQLRTLWPCGCPYSLSGEVDKSGAPLIRGTQLDRTKPDMLVHIPGTMAGNAVIIEVKPANGQPDGIEKDLRTLTAFRRHAHYKAAYLLIYGSSNGSLRRILDCAADCVERDVAGEIDLRKIPLWHHESPGTQVQSVPWHIEPV